MSVYIKIKEAKLSPQSKGVNASLLISSSDNTLKAQPIATGSALIWNTSMISSSKQKKISFEIKNESENVSYGKGQLYFSSLRSHPERQFSQNITLDNGGQLSIDVFYTERQNFIGQISFYNYEKCSKTGEETTAIAQTSKHESKRLFETPQKVNATPKTGGGIFFCCGDEGDDKLFTVEEDLSQPVVKASNPFQKQLISPVHSHPTEAVEFYKGPCKSTNLFSCCDAGLQDQKFNVIEDYYRDK